jgi:hypothetical protein
MADPDPDNNNNMAAAPAVVDDNDDVNNSARRRKKKEDEKPPPPVGPGSKIKALAAPLRKHLPRDEKGVYIGFSTMGMKAVPLEV